MSCWGFTFRGYGRCACHQMKNNHTHKKNMAGQYFLSSRFFGFCFSFWKISIGFVPPCLLIMFQFYFKTSSHSPTRLFAKMFSLKLGQWPKGRRPKIKKKEENTSFFFLLRFKKWPFHLHETRAGTWHNRAHTCPTCHLLATVTPAVICAREKYIFFRITQASDQTLYW